MGLRPERRPWLDIGDYLDFIFAWKNIAASPNDIAKTELQPTYIPPYVKRSCTLTTVGTVAILQCYYIPDYVRSRTYHVIAFEQFNPLGMSGNPLPKPVSYPA